MAKEKRLGRGLEALLGKVGGMDSPAQQTYNEMAAGIPMDGGEVDWMLQQKLASQQPNTVDIISVERNPFQPRLEFDEAELDQLSASLQTHGLLQPIVVRKVEDRYQIVAGERRFRAAMRAGWTEIPVHCLNVDDRQMVELALTENIQRKDLNAIEKAVSMANYLEMYGGTHEELARRLELDRSTITNLLRLLELPQQLQDAVRKGDLTQGHVRALLPLEQFEQIEVAGRIKKEGWSVRETERFVKQLVESGDSLDEALKNQDGWNVIDQNGQKRPAAVQSEQLVQLEQTFRERLGGMKVKLSQTNEQGKGKLVINFANHAEFERIFAMICKNKAVG